MPAKSKKTTVKTTTKSAKTTAAKKETAVKKKTAPKTKAATKTTKKEPVAKAKKTVTKKPEAKKVTAKKTPTKKTTATAKKATVKTTTAVKKPAAKATNKSVKAKASTPAKTKAKKKPMTKKAVSEQSNVIPIKSNLKIFGVAPYEVSAKEEYMNDEQKSHFRQILLNWKKELMEEVDRTMAHMKEDAERHADPSDSASQEEEFNLELRTRDRERKLIRKIDKAIARIEDDDYGYCDACGIEIGIRRLEARPTATLCIDCKTLDEIREKQTRA